jgi:predicted negative regulator of RcsB-dependent stress response
VAGSEESIVIDDYYNEQEQWERVKTWMRENGLWLAAGVAIGVLALFGWQWWQKYVEDRAVEASTRYQQALEALGRGDRPRGLTLVDELRRDYSASPYADQGDLVAARVHVENAELPKAAERLQRVMESSDDEELRLIARSRLARVQLAQGNFDAALATLDGAPAGAFAARFEEIRGDARIAKGDKAGALAAYRKARDLDTEGTLDSAALELKVADLVADGVASPAPAAAPMGAAPAAPAQAARP